MIELEERSVWLQIKSRSDGRFGADEVRGLLDQVVRKAAGVQAGVEARSAIVLEQPRVGRDAEAPIEEVFGEGVPIVVECATPEEEVSDILSTELASPAVIIEGLVSDLYKLVADVSTQNASLSYAERRRISTTEVDWRIAERLKAEDPSAIDDAVVSGALEPVDFSTPLDAADFFRGVKVRAGHVAAGLVLDRPDDVANVVAALSRQKHVLVCAPSGAGKSALVWLAATALAGARRWVQITGTATAADAAAIVAYIRSRRPTDRSPIGVVFDEVGSLNSDLWNVLARELSGLKAVCLLGSVRQEDRELIADQSATELIPVALDEDLARTVWERLSASGQTAWTHWREPFEESEGLMLEYVHVLTQGRRLAAVIGDQIRTRESQGRHDELAILRSAAVLFCRGGEVSTDRLTELIGLSRPAASQALGRLTDEHLVRESRPGVLGGLHSLRSNALVKASHDETVFRSADTLWRSLPIATAETLPRVVQSALAEVGSEGEARALGELAVLLRSSRDINFWTAVLAGLGLATLERNVAVFASVLREHGVARAQWALASLYGDHELEMPDLFESDQWAALRDAVRSFRALPKADLRSGCLDRIGEGLTPPACQTVVQAKKLVACLSPICGGEPVEIATTFDFANAQEEDIRQIAELLSAAYHYAPSLAESLAESFGGESGLLELFGSQTAWVATPIVETDGAHGRTVRADWFYVAESCQPDPHETVCDICETLMALSPRSDAAASDAVGASGECIVIGDFRPWSKEMPRENLPSKPRVAWNVAFRQLLQNRAGTERLTDYATKMAVHVRETEALFRRFTEKWIRGKGGGTGYVVISRKIEAITSALGDLAYAAPGRFSASMAEPGEAGVEDQLGSLLTSVLNNLVPRLSRLENPRAIAAFAGSLQVQADQHRESGIWRTVESPPRQALATLAGRLGRVSRILHEIACDPSQQALQRIVKAARRGGWGKAVASAALFTEGRANQRFSRLLAAVEAALKERGWTAVCVSRCTRQGESVSWPAREIAILVEIADFEAELESAIVETFSLGKEYIGSDFRYRVVPVMGGQVLASLARIPTSQGPVPDPEFSSEWSGSLPRPVFSSESVEALTGGFRACVEMSAVVACRGVSELHPEEEAVLAKCFDSFALSRETLAGAAQGTAAVHHELAVRFLDQSGGRVAREMETLEEETEVEEPLCLATDATNEAAALGLLILQAECREATEEGSGAV